MTDVYGLPDGYRARLEPAYFDDTVEGIVFQPEVYPRAESLAVELHLDTVVDVGAGGGTKIGGLHLRRPAWHLTAVDYGANLERARGAHPGIRWLEADLEDGVDLGPLNDAVVICADVIEHLRDPRPLLRSLVEAAPARVVLSTPDRELVGSPRLGPPANPCHVREWTANELGTFLVDQGLAIVAIEHTPSDDNLGHEHTTLVIACPA